MYMELGTHIQQADWKTENHTPAIESPDTVQADAWFEVKLTVGKEMPHPNTTEHHIRWIALFFLPDGEKFPYQIGRFEFASHGESTQGPNTSTIFTNPEVVTSFKTEKAGTLLASSYCNIHGLWQNSKKI